MNCVRCLLNKAARSDGLCGACANTSITGESRSFGEVYTVRTVRIAELERRLREYQRALLWCYGWINYALSEGLSPLEFAKYIEDDKWNKVGALVGEASDEVEP